MKKTKFLVPDIGCEVLKNSGQYPWAVCHSGVDNNFIGCSKRKLWVHKQCSGITGLTQITNAPGVANGRPVAQVMVDVEAAFCIMLCDEGNPGELQVYL